MHITAQGPVAEMTYLYCVEWDVKLYYTIPSASSFWMTLSTVSNRYYLPSRSVLLVSSAFFDLSKIFIHQKIYGSWLTLSNTLSYMF